ncbi:phosphoadenylyl-sulfate reductase [Caldiplasma sukawensis]
MEGKETLNELCIKLRETLNNAENKFSSEIFFSCSFSMEDMIILNEIEKNRIGIQIFTIDTGRLFQETYDLIQFIKENYGINIHFIYGDSNKIREMVENHGPNLFFESKEKRDLCCYIRKVEPLAQIKRKMKAMITGIRKEQTENRKNLKEEEVINGFTTINPLIDWSSDQVKEYIECFQVPINPLYYRGYKSIGCQPCTRFLIKNETEREGRWWWESGSDRECGLHRR